MALVLANINARVKVEGKDSNDQFSAERLNFIRDTCIELSTSQDYYWLWETKTVNIPSVVTDWINLATDFHKVETVCYINTQSGSNKQFFTYVPETDLIDQYYEIHNNVFGRYRLRWDSNGKRFQIAFINGPATGSTIHILLKKYMTSPETFPDYMEETIVRGALARFLTMLEGDDLEYGQVIKEDYRTLAKQQEKLGNNEMVHKPRRTKTNKELNDQQSMNQYRTGF